MPVGPSEISVRFIPGDWGFRADEENLGEVGKESEDEEL